MKIAMIGHKRIPSREGGVEIVVEEIAAALVKKGHQVHAYNRKGHHVSGAENDAEYNPACKDYRGIRIITVPTFQKSSLNAVVYAALASLRSIFGKYDVIHYHAEGPSSFVWLPHFFGLRTVVTIHGLDWQRAKWGGFATKFLKFGEKMAAKYADEIIVLSPAVQSYFLEVYNRKTHYIPNGIHRMEPKPVSVIKEKYQLEKDSYLLFLARIVPEKGLDYLLDAFMNIETDKKLVVAGGSSHTGEYYDAIRKKAMEDERIILTGFIQGKELEELFSNAYLFVLPSDIEGMPISLLEAMSYGNCCLVSDIPENKNVIGDCGYTFRKSDTEDLKEQLMKLLAEPELVRCMKERAAESVCTRFSWEKNVEETEALYQK